MTRTGMSISQVQFKSASRADVQTGLLGWVKFLVDGRLAVDGVTLRRTRHGRLTLSFPDRVDRSGNHHWVIRPISDRARQEIEYQVLRALGFVGQAS